LELQKLQTGCTSGCIRCRRKKKGEEPAAPAKRAAGDDRGRGFRVLLRRGSRGGLGQTGRGQAGSYSPGPASTNWEPQRKGRRTQGGCLSLCALTLATKVQKGFSPVLRNISLEPHWRSSSFFDFPLLFRLKYLSIGSSRKAK
jgi:hypothetical protein